MNIHATAYSGLPVPLKDIYQHSVDHLCTVTVTYDAQLECNLHKASRSYKILNTYVEFTGLLDGGTWRVRMVRP